MKFKYIQRGPYVGMKTGQRPNFWPGRRRRSLHRVALLPVLSVFASLLLPYVQAQTPQTTPAPAGEPTTQAAPSTQPDIVDLILVLTGEADLPARTAAAVKILDGRSTEDADKLVKILERKNDEPAKLAICLAIAESKSQNPQFIEHLIRFLNHGDDALQKAAALALNHYQDAHVQAQVDAYRARQILSYFRETMRLLFERTPEVDRPTLLLQWLQSPVAVQRETALTIIHEELTNKNAKPADAVLAHIRTMAGDTDQAVRQQLVEFLRDLRQIDDAPLIRQMLTSEQTAEVRESIYQALGLLEDAASLPVCVQGIADPEPDVAARAAEAVGQLSQLTNGLDEQQKAAAVDALLARSEQAAGHPLLTEKLIEALARLGDPRALTILTEHAGDKEPSAVVRRIALRGVGKLGNANHLAVIVDRLSRDSDPLVRETAAGVLGKLAGNAEQIAPLRERVNPAVEKSPAVQKQAWDTYRQVFGRLSLAEQQKAMSNWAENDAMTANCRAMLLADMEKSLANDNNHRAELAKIRDQLGNALSSADKMDEAAAAWQRALDTYTAEETLQRGGVIAKLIEYHLAGAPPETEQALALAAGIQAAEIRDGIANRLIQFTQQLSGQDPQAAIVFLDLLKQKIPDQFGTGHAAQFDALRAKLTTPQSAPASAPTTSTSPAS